jgi:hypothetical protein
VEQTFLSARLGRLSSRPEAGLVYRFSKVFTYLAHQISSIGGLPALD